MQNEYTVLFNGITDIIAALQELQLKAEQAYLDRLEEEESEDYAS